MSVVEKKISLVDVEVKEPCDHPVWLQPASNEERFPRSKILEDVQAMKERARKSKPTISVPGAFRMKGDQYNDSFIQEGGESNAELLSPIVGISTDRSADQFAVNEGITLSHGNTFHTPLHPHHQTDNNNSGQSTLSASSNVQTSVHQLSPGDLSLSLPELKETQDARKGNFESSIHLLSDSSNSLNFGKETIGVGRGVVQIKHTQIADDSPLDHTIDQTPIQGHKRHHSDGSSNSIVAGTSCDVQTLKERARRGRNFLHQPGAYAVKNLEDSPAQISGQIKISKDLIEESPKSIEHHPPLDVKALKDRARRARASITQPGAYSSQNRVNDEKSPKKASHVRHNSGGSNSSIPSLPIDVKSIKERARRGHGLITTPGAFPVRDSEVGIAYAPPRDMGQDRQLSEVSLQSGMSPYKDTAEMAGITLHSTRNSIHTSHSLVVSPQLQIPRCDSDQSMSSNTIDIQAIKRRARHGRNHEMRVENSTHDIREGIIRDGSTPESYSNEKTNQWQARHDNRTPRTKVEPGSNWVDPFIELTERPESNNSIAVVVPIGPPEIPRVEFRSNTINAPVQHQSVWELEQVENKRALSPFCKIEKNICLMLVGIFLVVVGGIGIAIGLSQASVSRPCLEAQDKGDQSLRFQLISDMLGASVQNSERRMAMCWLADTDERQISLEDESEVAQRFFLALFYYSTVSKENIGMTMKSWLSGESECQWSGVNCNDGKVSILNLEVSNLEGSIPSEIALLSNLSQLHLTENKLFGSLPDELFKLSSLLTLVLDYNQFGGTLSSHIGSLSQLTGLNINSNKFTGVLPSEIFDLIKLGENHICCIICL
jgi:hypothetical protein